MTDNATEITPRSVFITGGDSGIGRLLTRALVKRGHRVTSTTPTAAGAAAIRAAGALPTYPDLARPGEIRGLLTMARADVLVHLAGCGLSAPPQHAIDYEAAYTAITSADELTLAAGQSGLARMIFASFAFLYGDTGGAVVAEEAALDSSNPLFRAAIAAETAVIDGGIPGYVLRTGYLYGGHSEALKALYEHLKVGGSVPGGPGMAAWLHEDDFVAALLRLIEQPIGQDTAGVYNLAEDAAASPDTFINEFSAAMGVSEPGRMNSVLARLRLPATQRALLSTSVAISSQRFKAAFGWQPGTASRTAGLERALLQWRAGEGPAAPDPLPERAIVTV